MPHRRVLFARVGWMRFYHRLMPDDKPVGGGSFNDENTGSEVANFFPAGNRVYGFFQTPAGARLDFRRIDPAAPDDDELRHVLLIFVARRPTGGQVVVGWYPNARLLAEPKRSTPHEGGRKRWHNAVARKADAVLLPSRARTLVVKGGLGGFGQANVCYTLTAAHKSKLTPWMRQAIRLAEEYRGPNLMLDHSIDEVQGTVERLDSIDAGTRGQGFASTLEQRRAIEAHAMKRAIKYFRMRFSEVRDVCLEGRSYDVHCCNGSKELLVEVKGTTSDGSAVFLTRNEYELARKGNSALYVLHSIRLVGERAIGGQERVLEGWDVGKGKAIPVLYRYQLPGSVTGR